MSVPEDILQGVSAPAAMSDPVTAYSLGSMDNIPSSDVVRRVKGQFWILTILLLCFNMLLGQVLEILGCSCIGH